MRTIFLLLICFLGCQAHAGNRRVRHLNPANAGADTALDARFIGINDANPVDTWASRRPASIDGVASSTVRPQFSVAGLNGMAATSYDGSNDYFETGVARNDSEITIMGVAVRGASSSNRSPWGNRGGSSHGRILRTTTTPSAFAAQIGGTTVIHSASVTSPFIHTMEASSTANTFEAWFNGQGGTLTTYYYAIHANNSFCIGRAGASSSEYFYGQISAVYVWPIAISNALRRRFEQSLAFIFHIPL